MAIALEPWTNAALIPEPVLVPPQPATVNFPIEYSIATPPSYSPQPPPRHSDDETMAETTAISSAPSYRLSRRIVASSGSEEEDSGGDSQHSDGRGHGSGESEESVSEDTGSLNSCSGDDSEDSLGLPRQRQAKTGKGISRQRSRETATKAVKGVPQRTVHHSRGDPTPPVAMTAPIPVPVPVPVPVPSSASMRASDLGMDRLLSNAVNSMRLEADEASRHRKALESVIIQVIPHEPIKAL